MARIVKSAPIVVAPAAPVKVKPAPKAAAVKLCGCGCGATVKRRFLQGHDAKLKGSLLKVIKDPKATAVARKAAVTQMTQAGWSSFLPIPATKSA